MTDKLNDRWADRDFLVLRTAAEKLEAGARAVTTQDLAVATGLEHSDVVLALSGLTDVYVTASDASSYGGKDFLVHGLTERGRRTVGIWPEGEQIGALVDALRQAEATVDDPEERSALRRAAGALASISREVMTDVVSAMARAQVGL
ncbi:hypothetical protein [Georgenia daeguensis]|uniref:Uncharacterized protein n=1 Tax=Georgenia daeguensis TaxID=908355 RepID=A0ABP6UR07_9MICO